MTGQTIFVDGGRMTLNTALNYRVPVDERPGLDA
jgi:hypothetical protein